MSKIPKLPESIWNRLDEEAKASFIRSFTKKDKGVSETKKKENKKEKKGKKHKTMEPSRLIKNRTRNIEFLGMMNNIMDDVLDERQRSLSIDQKALIFKDLLNSPNLSQQKARNIDIIKMSTKQMVHTLFGTKMPVIRMYYYKSSSKFGEEVMSSGGSIGTNIPLTAGNLAYFSLFAAVFDEYRPKGKFKYRYFPKVVVPTGYDTSSSGAIRVATAYAVGAIDYVDTTNSLNSVQQALFYDTHKIFPLTHNGNLEKELYIWKGHMLGSPDNIWLNVSTTNTAFVCWKCVNAGNVNSLDASVYWGFITYEIDIEFRQQAAV